jgi:hypothetical protein
VTKSIIPKKAMIIELTFQIMIRPEKTYSTLLEIIIILEVMKMEKKRFEIE